MTERTLTTRDMAAILGVSERRVRALAVHRNRKQKVGWQHPTRGIWLFSAEDVEALRPRKLRQ